MYNFESYCTTLFLKFVKFSKIEHMVNELAKIVLIKCAFMINGCSKHKYHDCKIKSSCIYEIFDFISIFAAHCITYCSKFIKISRTKLVKNEFAKFILRKFAFATCAFAKFAIISQVHQITELIYNTMSISDEKVNKINALEKSVYSTILNKSN
jgi:hypothetical protein